MLVIGLICGAVLSGLYFGYQENQPGQFGSGIRSLLEKERTPPPQAETAVPQKAPEPAPKVKLDYHEVLPTIDEVISESVLPEDEEPVEDRDNHQYILQAGSYKAERDAESMKAKLALAGFEAVIQRVIIDNQGTYYRVRMGPYKSKRKLQLDRKRLAKQGINTMALRLEDPKVQASQTH
jgi:cell division protein FtsN